MANMLVKSRVETWDWIVRAIRGEYLHCQDHISVHEPHLTRIKEDLERLSTTFRGRLEGSYWRIVDSRLYKIEGYSLLFHRIDELLKLVTHFPKTFMQLGGDNLNYYIPLNKTITRVFRNWRCESKQCSLF